MKNNKNIETKLSLVKKSIEAKVQTNRDLHALFYEEKEKDTAERLRILNVGYTECLAMINLILQDES